MSWADDLVQAFENLAQNESDLINNRLKREKKTFRQRLKIKY